jgi:hypothetical protein
METQAIVSAGSAIVKSRPFADLRVSVMKNSPELFIGVGVAGVLVSTVLACRATLKAPAAIASTKEKFSAIKEATTLAAENPEMCEYTKEDRTSDLITASVQTAWSFTKLYGIPAVTMAGSLWCIFYGHGITLKRNAGLTAAVTALTTGYNAYRERVKDQLGVDAERKIYMGEKSEKITVDSFDKDGKIKSKNQLVTTYANPNLPSVYAKYFDEGSTEWKNSPEMNRAFLQSMQNMANDKLQIDKVLFLNDVYEMLGLERTQAGVVCGWAITDDEGDHFVDFGIFNPENEQARRFINGDEPSVLLDFNVDGTVYRKL